LDTPAPKASPKAPSGPKAPAAVPVAPPAVLLALRTLARTWGRLVAPVPGSVALYRFAVFAILGHLVDMLAAMGTAKGDRLQTRFLALHEAERARDREAAAKASTASSSSTTAPSSPRYPYGSPALDVADLPAPIAAWFTTGRDVASDTQPPPLAILTREPLCPRFFSRAARETCPGALCSTCRATIGEHNVDGAEPTEETADLEKIDEAFDAVHKNPSAAPIGALALAALAPLSEDALDGVLVAGHREADAWAIATAHAGDALPSTALGPIFAGLAARFTLAAELHSRRVDASAARVVALRREASGLRAEVGRLSRPVLVAIERDGTIYGVSDYAGEHEHRVVAVRWSEDAADLAARLTRAANLDSASTAPSAARRAA
jgi:hypothetical protein